SYAIDGQEGVRHPVGMTARYLEAETHVVTAGSSFIENLARCIERIELDVEDIIAAPIASGVAVTSEAERALGVLAVDLGGGATQLALFRGGSVAHTSALPVGGGHLTQDLAVGLRLTLEQSERLKRERGCAQVAEVEADEYVAIHPIGDPDPREVPRRLIA